MNKRFFYDLDSEGARALFGELGEKPFRGKQLLERVYHQGVGDPALMTEFSAPLRQKLAHTLDFSLPALVERQVSVDSTVKLLLRLSDGELVETVLIPDEERLTQCVSTQAGCAMGCAFCRTGEAGLTRNLSSGEIVAQVEAGALHSGFGRRPTNIVFMGMGEPLHNFDNTVRAFDALTGEWGLGLGRRKITVSTCGLANRIAELPARVVGSLAVSLNATTDEVRDRIMPVNHSFPIATLVETLEKLELAPRERITIEYVLLGGVNDSSQDARRLVRLLSRVRCKVNLIPYNSQGESAFTAPTPEAVTAFQTILLDKEMVAVVRKSRGQDILAACGQLKAETLEKESDSE